jgi:hypothetical protein
MDDIKVVYVGDRIISKWLCRWQDDIKFGYVGDRMILKWVM